MQSHAVARRASRVTGAERYRRDEAGAGDCSAEGTASRADGHQPLPDGRGTFASRAMLVNGAQRSLDVQYYLKRGIVKGMPWLPIDWLL